MQRQLGAGHLLLSGYSLGHSSGAQTGLDFSDREKKLFASSEMGDNAIQALKLCMEIQTSVLSRLHTEPPVLSDALRWCRKVT